MANLGRTRYRPSAQTKFFLWLSGGLHQDLDGPKLVLCDLGLMHCYTVTAVPSCILHEGVTNKRCGSGRQNAIMLISASDDWSPNILFSFVILFCQQKHWNPSPHLQAIIITLNSPNSTAACNVLMRGYHQNLDLYFILYTYNCSLYEFIK